MKIRHAVRILAAGSLLTLAGVGVLAMRAQAKQNLAQGTPMPAAPQDGAGFGLSPEEAVIRLLPYKLSADEVPPGYRVGSVFSVFTDLPQFASDSNPAAEFADNRNAGLIVGYAQDLVTADQSATGSNWAANVSVQLFADSASANAFVSGVVKSPGSTGLQADRVTLGETRGDAAAAWHVTGWTSEDGRPEGSYLIRWQRGPIVFVLSTAIKPFAQDQQADAESLATAIDAIEQTRPLPHLGPATVTPPASESQRFQAAIQLNPFFAPAEAAPDGYGASTSYFTHPAEDVAFAADPASALRAADEQWRLVISADQVFRSNENNDVILGAAATLCGDSQAAGAYASVFPTPPRWTSSTAAPPVQLGDATVVFQSSGPAPDGSPREDISLNWTHGALVLHVGMSGPVGTTSMDQLVAFAQQIEARFQANPLPTNGPNKP